MRTLFSSFTVQGLLIVLKIAAISLPIIAFGGARASPIYKVTDLGTLGGLYSGGASINNLGQVTGASETVSGQIHGFLYSQGTMTDLGTLGGSSSWGTGINNLGQIAGFSTVSSGTTRAFLYRDGTMTDLGTLGGQTSAAYGINDSAQITGISETVDGNSRAFLYSGATMLDLGTLPGGNFSHGYAINNLGQITGRAENDISYGWRDTAFLYSDGKMIDLFDQHVGLLSSYGQDINNQGLVVGHITAQSIDFTSVGVFLSDDGVRLPSFPRIQPACRRCPMTGARINNHGNAVGGYIMLGEFDNIIGDGIFVFDGNTSFDLQSSLDPVSGAGWTIKQVGDINDSGQIVAIGFREEFADRALLLTPIPEPSIYLQMIMGLCIFGLAGRRRRALAAVHPPLTFALSLTK